MPLPALGPIDPPVTSERVAQTPLPAPELPLSEAPERPGTAGNDIAATVKSPAELALERRMSGAFFAREPSAPSQGTLAAPQARTGMEAVRADDPDGPHGTDASGTSGMSALLRPTATPAAVAQRLANTRFL